MPKSSFVDFKAVKAAVTMEQVLTHYGLMERFKRGKDSLSGPCPIHKGENPTQFRVSISKNVWNCFSECKHGGNVLDFIAKMEGESIHAAALKAIQWFKLDPEAMAAESKEEGEERSEEAKSESVPKSPTKASAMETSAPNKPLKFRLDKLEREHPYLMKDRGLTLETIVDFRIGYCAKGMMEGRIAIPIHNSEGQVVAYAGRFVGEPAENTPRYKLPPGFRKSQELFNFDRAIKEPGERPLVVVVGYFDCMKLHQNGCRKVTGLLGYSMSAAQEELLRKHSDKCGRIILMLTENEAGRAAREEIAARLAKFAFVKIHVFAQKDLEPEHLSAEEVKTLLA